MANLKDQEAFWSALSDAIQRGEGMVKTLHRLATEVDELDLSQAVETLAQHLESGGKSMAAAMQSSPTVFPRTFCAIIQAGERAGIVDVALSHIVEGLQDESFTLSERKLSESQEMASAFKAVGRLITCGVPLLEALDVITKELENDALRETLTGIREGLQGGRTLSELFSRRPDVFPQAVVQAVAMGEEYGTVDRVFLEIEKLLKEEATPAAQKTSTSQDSDRPDGDTESLSLQAVNSILCQAVEDKAESIHFEDTDKDFWIRFRIDGVMRRVDPPASYLAQPVIARLKQIAGMDPFERTLPQDGRGRVAIEGKAYDLRISVVPTSTGERVVIRILDLSTHCWTLSEMPISEASKEKLKSLYQLPYGLIACTGPAGSGKTTLLYAMLQEFDREQCSVMAVEDPVEMDLDGVAQTQIKPHLGMTYMNLIKSCLRQDPDVLMVGEIRDLETADICVRASLAGHIILTTLHANTAIEAVRRLLHMGVEPFLLNASLRAVAAQRLVRKLCYSCKKSVSPNLDALPPAVARFLKENSVEKLWEPVGCEACKDKGYSGRIALHEILIPDAEFQESLLLSTKQDDLQAAASRTGMKTFLQDGLFQAAEGLTSLDELLRWVPV